MTDHLGPRLARKPLHLFWILDVSGSMDSAGKIEALNDAMRVAVEAVRTAAAENPGAQVLARAICFAHDAVWHVDQPMPVEDLDWSDVSVVERGTTEIGLAISAVTDAIRDAAQDGRGLPPALVLISDGKPTDLATPTFGAALRELAGHPWGAKASRIAIGIGADADMDALQRFVGHDEIPALRADSAMELSHYLRWASTVVMDEGSRPVTDWSDGPALGSDTTVIDGPGSTVKVTSDAPPPTGPARHDLAPPPLVAPPPATDDATRPGPAW